MTVHAVVVVLFVKIVVFLFGVCHGHHHHCCANWTLEESLALKVLTLSLSDSQLVVAELAIKVINFFIKTIAAS